MRIFRLALACAVCMAWLAGAALAGDAEGEMSPYMTPPEIGKRADDLAAKGWKGRDINAALSISRGNRQLFEIYVGLYDKRIPPLSIQRSFALCKGEPADINELVVSQHLYTRHWPDPDVLIRTSGEMRVSNFLLWQISYAELVITPTLWPDFRKPQFFAALEEYARRHRRFGGV